MAKMETILLPILSSCILVWAISAHPTVREELAEHEEKLQLDRVEEEVHVGTEKEVVDGQPTVKCEEIVPDVGAPGPENHAACEAHCVTLGEEYEEGSCVAGICHCRDKQRTHIKQNQGRTHPTVKCEHIVPLHGEPGRQNHEACRSHCRGLGNVYDDGECTPEGVCHCRQSGNFQSPTSVRSAPYANFRATTRGILDPCDNAESKEGKPNRDTHGACLAHCRLLDKNHKEGKCVGTVCHCGSRPGTPTSTSAKNRQPPQDAGTAEKSATVRCEPLAPRDGGTGHEHCSTHCETLGRRGKCVDGLCRCVPGTPLDAHHSDLIVAPDRKEVERRVECETASESEGGMHEACKIHCRGLKKNYLEGHCVQGFCRCSL